MRPHKVLHQVVTMAQPIVKKLEAREGLDETGDQQPDRRDGSRLGEEQTAVGG